IPRYLRFEMTSIPPEFLSSPWSLETNEGFDAYLEAKGVSWLFRKGIVAAAQTITWTDLEDSNWQVLHESLGTIAYEFRLGEAFTDKSFDKTTCKILITVERG
ncbi:hypothetical protein PFISCL1PPCAC_13076, partial [Pristionchus fissidentatus]